MSIRVTGADVLARMDQEIGRARQALADSIEAVDEGEARQAEISREELAAFSELAALRLDVISTQEEHDLLTEADRKVVDLLSQHDAFTSRQKALVSDAAEKIGALETRRGQLAEERRRALEAYEEKVDEIQAGLSEDPAYQTLLTAAEDAAAIAERAEKKLELAREDRVQKGDPYETDPLFSYLWERKFRTTEYDGRGLIKALDGWVARLCKYDRAYLNYARLIELPERLAEHLERVEADRADAVEALEEAEAAALEAGGADALQTAADGVLEDIKRADAEIDSKEAEHLRLTTAYEAALTNASGPARQAREALAASLKAASFPDLRVLASETVSLADDRVVDRLVKLRAEQMELEIQADQLEAAPAARRRGLKRFERVRSGFKRAGLDRSDVLFRSGDLDSLFYGLLRGEVDEDSVLHRLRKSAKRRRPRTHPGFGGPPRGRTLGLPEIVGDVVWEIAKESMRAGGGSPWGRRGRATRGKAPRRSRLPRPPKRGGRGGGFRTGGGF
ncbi:MAG: hypothetical protein AAFX03_10885 [Pseudomonadota bacterium]